MVKLRNIKVNNQNIECDIYPEDSSLSGSLIVNLETGKVVDYTLPENYAWCIKHIHHASEKLIEIFKDGEIPEEKIVMWI